MWDPYRIPVGTGKALVRPDRGGAAPRGLGTSGQRRVAGDAGPSYASLRDPRGRARSGDRGRRAGSAAPRLRGLGAARLRPPVRAQRALPRLLHAARCDTRHRRALGGRARRAERGVPPGRPRLRAARGRLLDQRHDQRGGARPPSRPAPRALPRLSARDLRALRPPRRRSPPLPLARDAAGAPPRLLAGADVRLGGRGARARHRVDGRRARPRDGAAARAPRGRGDERRGAPAPRRDGGLRPALPSLPRARAGVSPGPREPRRGHRRAEGPDAPALAPRLPARVLDAPRHPRLLLRQRVRHDRAVLPALRQRPRRPLPRPEPRAAPARGSALAPHARPRPRHAGAGRARRERPPLPPRPRQRGLGVGRAERGPRARRRRRRHRGARARRGRRAARLRAAPGRPGAVVSEETSAQLRARLDAAVAARARLRGRPLRHTIAALAGAAVLVRSGRAAPLSAPAFQRALAAVDPVLAATVVTAYWPGGEVAREDAALGRAAVVVATGGDATLAALAPRLGRRLIAHGPRWSVALVGRAGAGDVDAIALDTALHDQRGCLSPHAVYVTDDARAFAERLAAALDGLGARLPPGPASVDARAAARLVAAEAEWAPGAAVLGGAGGTVIYEDMPAFRPTAGRRTVRVHPLRDVRELPELLPPGRIECLGLAGIDPAPLVAAP